MIMDILAFGTEDTAARFTLDYNECATLMEACANLRDQRYPDVLQKLPPMFDDDDLAKAVGSAEGAKGLMAIFELEQALHQALHMFPQGHSHGDDHDHDH